MRSDSSQVSSQAEETADDAGTAEELLIEEISIDGMCGVY
jgi:mycofactocin precursor